MLLVVHPIALVLSSISVGILSEPMGLVVFPLAVVDVAIGMYQATASIGLIVLPVALVNATVAPDLVSSPMPEAGLHVPLALVLCTVRQDHHGSLLLLNAWLVILVIIAAIDEFWQILPDGLDSGSLFFQLLWIHLDMNGATH